MSQLADTSARAPFIEQKVSEIEGHPAWYADANLSMSETLLKGQKPFTYILRHGDKELHYLLSFVDENQLVQHRPISIQYSLAIKGWYFLNSVQHARTYLSDLIPVAMHVDPPRSNPLLKKD